MPPRKQKSTKASKEETTDSPAEWWDEAIPIGDVLPRMEGINYYILRSAGELTTSQIEEREVKNVAFHEAEHICSTDVRGNPLKDSPTDDNPDIGTLFVPLSVARRIRGFLEEKKMPQESLIDNILVLQKTGEKLKTRYPLVEIITPKEYAS